MESSGTPPWFLHFEARTGDHRRAVSLVWWVDYAVVLGKNTGRNPSRKPAIYGSAYEKLEVALDWLFLEGF
jgi:hypothetical protein